jgi:lipid-A-disaccharide synthase-like uncharacterized protein
LSICRKIFSVRFSGVASSSGIFITVPTILYIACRKIRKTNQCHIPWTNWSLFSLGVSTAKSIYFLSFNDTVNVFNSMCVNFHDLLYCHLSQWFSRNISSVNKLFNV